MDEETSIFIKKYKQILKFKSEATKKNQKNKRYNFNTNDSNIISNQNNNLENFENKKSFNILPKINISTIRNSTTSQNKIKEVENIQKNRKEMNSLNINNKNKEKFDLYKEANKLKNNSKEYKKFISKQSDIAPKVNIKLINNTLYQRLLKK